MKCLRLFTGAPCIISLLIAQTGCHREPATSAAPPANSTSTVERMTVGKPVRKTLKLSTTQPGRIEAFEVAPLYPKLAGYVRKSAG